ncbi:MAG: GTPase HflX, partial [Eubacterium sp.]
QIEVVNQVLRDIGSGHKQVLMVYNKMDKLEAEERARFENKAARESDSICISAKAGLNIESLTAAINLELKGLSVEKTYCIPYEDSRLMAILHEKSTILETGYTDAGTLMRVTVGDDFPLHQYEKYEVDS